jgi:ribonuclease HIII
MSDSINQALQALRSALARCAAQGHPVSEPRRGDWHWEADVEDGKTTVKAVVYFNRKGTLTPVVQGKQGPLRDAVRDALLGQASITSSFLPPGVSTWIGVDESGKGDYFGPLVTAALAVDAASMEHLKNALVRDSKQMTDAMIRVSASSIRATCAGRFTLVVTMPEKYNELLAGSSFGGNSQRLLAWQHARAIENVLEALPEVRHAICDQFGREHVIERALLTRGRQINLIQRTKAESDPAVAAASVLARDDFLSRMRQLEERSGCTLPLGASAERAIAQAVRFIVAREGREALRCYAKLHFQTTRKVLSSLDFR